MTVVSLVIKDAHERNLDLQRIGKLFIEHSQEMDPNTPQRPYEREHLETKTAATIEANDLEDNDLNLVSLRIPWRYKWIALLCIVLLPIGHTWTGSALGPLKNTLREELGITNTQFGVISSADAFVNTIFPIVGGLLLDWWGPNVVTLCCTSVILVGSVVAASGVQVGLWRVLVGGHALMGFGIAVLDSATQKVGDRLSCSTSKKKCTC